MFVLDREPTVAELAGHLEMTEEGIVEGLAAANGYSAGSLDAPTDSGGDDGRLDKGGRTYADTLGDCDPAMELVEDSRPWPRCWTNSTTASAN